MTKSSLLCLVLLLMPHLVSAQQGAERLNVADVLDPDGTASRAVGPIQDPVDREPAHWTVVVASYAEQAVADTAAAAYHARLGSMGYPVAVFAEEAQGIATYRVIVGRYQRLAAAQAGMEALVGEIPAAAWLLNVHTVIPDEAWPPHHQTEAPLQPPDDSESRTQTLPDLEASSDIDKPPPRETEPDVEVVSVVEAPSTIAQAPVRWTVVVASYTERALAYAAATRYRARLAPVAVAVLTEEAQGAPTYRVIAGRYQRLAAAQAGLDALAADVRDAAWLLNVQTEIPDDAWVPQERRVADNVPSDDREAEHRERPAVEPSFAAQVVSTWPLQSIPVQSPGVLYREHRHWAIVVASYAESAVADAAATRYRAEFEALGYPVAVIAEEKLAIATYQVVVGEFPHLAAAEAGLEALSGKVPDEAWLLNVQAEVPDKAWLLYVQAVTGKPIRGLTGLQEPSFPIAKKHAVSEAKPVAEAPSVIEETDKKEFDTIKKEVDAVEGESPIVSDTVLVDSPPTAVAEPASEAPAVDHSPMRWTVVVGSHAERAVADEKADKYRTRLASTAFQVAVVTGEVEGMATYRVVVGRFKRLAAAREGLQALGDKVPQDAWLLYNKTPISVIARATNAQPTARTLPSKTVPVREEMPAVSLDLPMHWTVVVASYPERAEAEASAAEYRTRLESTGYPVAVIDEEGTYRVVAGRFKKLAEAQQGQQAMDDAVPATSWLLYIQGKPAL